MSAVKKILILSIAALAATFELSAQEPLYIVNGVERSSVADIPQSQIENIQSVEITDKVIATYGARASAGLFIVTLKYDTAPRFLSPGSFTDWIIDNVEWDLTDPTARFVVRYTIDSYGKMVLGDILESTEKRLQKRVLKALAKSPGWQPATKNGAPIAVSGVLNLRLPAGRSMPREYYVTMH